MSDEVTKSEVERGRKILKQLVVGTVAGFVLLVVACAAIVGVHRWSNKGHSERFGVLSVHRHERRLVLPFDDSPRSYSHVVDSGGNVIERRVDFWEEVGPDHDVLLVSQGTEVRALSQKTGRPVSFVRGAPSGEVIGMVFRCFNRANEAITVGNVGSEDVVIVRCFRDTSDRPIDDPVVLRYSSGRVVADRLDDLLGQATGRRHAGVESLRRDGLIEFAPRDRSGLLDIRREIQSPFCEHEVYMETRSPETCPSTAPDGADSQTPCGTMAFLVDWDSRSIRGMPIPLALVDADLHWIVCDGQVTPVVGTPSNGRSRCNERRDAWPTTEPRPGRSVEVRAAWVDLGTLLGP